MNRDLIDQFKRYGTLFWEASRTKDKLLILGYIFCSPIRVCCKLLGFKPSRRYLARLTIRNTDGLFDCGRSYISSRVVTTDSERELREQFRIDHGVFIDVGAHIGKYAISVARRLAENGVVIAIEPDPSNFDLLSRNVSLNGLKNVILKNVACGDKNGTAMLYVHDEFSTLNSFYINRGGQKVRVDTITLDTLVDQLRIGRIDLIKVDVEAAEADVMRGSISLLKRYRPKIVFEAYNALCLRHVMEILSPLGYVVRNISRKNYFAFLA
jgi:FkbM family methyltransferase